MPISTELIWERFSDELRSFIGRRVRDGDLASDLLQETFVRIHQGLGSLKEDDRVLAWVYRVARHTIANHFRKTAGKETEAAADVLAEERERDNFNEEVGRWLFDMLPSMPERYRAAVQLAEVEGLTQREVGARLGLSLSGAKSRVQRGREMLRDILLRCCHLEFDRSGNVVDYEQHGKCSSCCRSPRTPAASGSKGSGTRAVARWRRPGEPAKRSP